MSPSIFFKKGTSQQPITLDQSERLMLKNLASIFLSKEFPGSQLEALLWARASTSASILTPSPAAEGGSGGQPSIPSSSPEPEPEPESFQSSASTRPSVHLEDRSFEGSTITGTPNEPVEVDNFSHLTQSIAQSITESFSNSTIKDSIVNNQSFNGNTTVGYGNRATTHRYFNR